MTADAYTCQGGCGNNVEYCACEAQYGSDPLADMRNGQWLAGQVFPPLQWAVPGIIPEGASVLVGPPKVGKSWLVLQLALSIAAGGYAIGAIAVEQRPVLYLALEDGDRRLQSRCRKVFESDNLPAAFHRLLRLTDTIEATCNAFLDRHPTGVVFLDTLGKVMPPAKPGEDRYARDYRISSLLKSIVDDHPGSTMVIVHHDRKASSEDFVDAVSGSHGIAGGVDTIVVLHRARLSAEGSIKVTGRDADDGEYALDFNDGRWTVVGGDLSQAASAAESRRESSNLGDRSASILGYARNQAPKPITPSDVARVFEMKNTDAGQYLGRLADAGRLSKPGRGLYSVSVESVESVESTPDSTLSTHSTQSVWMDGEEDA